MRYISTRGGMSPRGFREILLEGLATDGGLAMPESYPRYEAPDLARLRKLKYRDLAFDILSRYIDDIPAADLKPGAVLEGKITNVTRFGALMARMLRRVPPSSIQCGASTAKFCRLEALPSTSPRSMASTRVSL